jgi:hypothetical protein
MAKIFSYQNVMPDLDKYVQQTNDPVEGAGVYKLNNGEGYVLMYDVYTKGRYQFTLTKDFESFKIVDDKVTVDFQPRHGTVIQITAKEKKRLMKHWHFSDHVAQPDRERNDFE